MQGVSSCELAAVLRPLAAPDPPLELLLPALLRMCSRAAAERHTPDTSLAFPIRPDPGWYPVSVAGHDRHPRDSLYT